MTKRKVANLLDADQDVPIVDEEEDCDVTGTFKLGTRTIASSEMQSLTATLFRESNGAIINSRDNQDVNGVNGGSFDADNVFTLKLTALDNAVDSSLTDEENLEWHVIRLTWTWLDGDGDTRTGRMESRFPVRRLKTTTP